MQLISTKTHGMLDYSTAAMLAALPAMLHSGSAVSGMLRMAALGTTVYSMLTRYELGLKGVLPMKTHLMLDAMSGALFLASPLLFPNERGNVKAVLAGIGAFELAAATLTERQPQSTPQAQQEFAV